MTFRLMVLAVIGIFGLTACFVEAQPPDPELFSAIREARKYVNLKTSYDPSELQECFTDSLNILAANWHHLPAIYQREFQGIFLRPGAPGSLFGSVYLPDKYDTPHFDSTTPRLATMRHRPTTSSDERCSRLCRYLRRCAGTILPCSDRIDGL